MDFNISYDLTPILVTSILCVTALILVGLILLYFRWYDKHNF